MRNDCWPDALQILLLQAGLAKPGAALPAWREFCQEAPDDLPADYLRLVPLVAVNLKDGGPETPRRDLLQAQLRETWLKTQRLFHLTGPVLRELQSSGIDFLVLKGAALAVTDYPHPGARPMADVDLLIRPADVRRLELLLAGRDWMPVKTLSDSQWTDQIRFRHEMTFLHAQKNGPALDIHWHLVDEARDPEAEALFWRDAVPCALPGLATRTLQPADQLLHTCIHGARWNEVSAVRWLADAALIARRPLDWRRLEAQARRFELLDPVRGTLLCLDGIGAALPADIVAHWRALTPTRRERAEGVYRSTRPDLSDRTRQLALAFLRLRPERGRTLGFWRDAFSYMRQIHHFRTVARRAGFITYLVFYRLKGL